MASIVRGLLVALAFLSTVSVAAAQAPGPQPVSAVVPSPSGFVRAHRAVSTGSSEAQQTFDDGLTLLYAFNPEEARRAFGRAAAADPDLAMAFWGIAMSFGVNINTSYDPGSQRQGHDAIVKAQARAGHATPVERALIEAAAARYARSGKNDAEASAQAYKDAMQAAASAYPGDDDVVTLAAEAAMDQHPWGFWSDDGKPQPGTLEIVRALQTVLARDPAHIGANHLLIHALEAGPHPEEALDAAHRLAADTFEPAAEHLAHMPAHTLVRSGDYAAAAEANMRALDAFNAYLGGPHAPGHESYYGHDCLFGVYAFMMAGEHANAEHAASRCEDAARRYAGYVAVRFRRWNDLPQFAGETTFFRGMSAAVTGRLGDALSAAQQLDATKQDNAAVAAEVLRAKVHAERGESALEIAALEKAVRNQDKLGYAEPPGWFYPVRESLGGAYYRAGQYAEAERAFRDDLAKDPRNPRSLFGLSKTLEREGRSAAANEAQQAFAVAWQHADVQLDMRDL
jgi:tetratricopeptide (TPR) repeat protein